MTPATSASAAGNSHSGAPPTTKCQADDDGDNTYMVTVIAEDTMDNMDSQDVRVMVTNEEEPGTVSLSTMRPAVDAEVTATLTDPDGMVSGERWQWAKSMDMTTWEDIGGATSNSYTPVAADDVVGYYLRATVRYTDGESSGKSAMDETDNMVTSEPVEGDPLLTEYDPDSDGVIERADMRRAVTNFFGSSPTLTTAEMRRLVGIFFS